MPDWLSAGVIGAIIAAAAAIGVAAIQKRRTAPEQRLDAMAGLQRLMEEVQEERTHAIEQARLSREDIVKEQAAHAGTKAQQAVEREATASRERIKDAYIEILRDHIVKGYPPPPPDYPKGT